MSDRKLIAVVDRNPIFGLPVTVQLGYMDDNQFVLEHCDHAGAEEEQLDYGRGEDSDLRTEVVCNKCGMFYNDLDNEWQRIV